MAPATSSVGAPSSVASRSRPVGSPSSPSRKGDTVASTARMVRSAGAVPPTAPASSPSSATKASSPSTGGRTKGLKTWKPPAPTGVTSTSGRVAGVGSAIELDGDHAARRPVSPAYGQRQRDELDLVRAQAGEVVEVLDEDDAGPEQDAVVGAVVPAAEAQPGVVGRRAVHPEQPHAALHEPGARLTREIGRLLVELEAAEAF